jgi:hypothetical protein
MKKKTSARQNPRPPRLPAGCLASGDKTGAGDENIESFEAPEYKAMATKGIPLAGKITLDQYERLVGLGYDGQIVMRWTAYHADQELRRVSPGGGAMRATSARRFSEGKSSFSKSWRPQRGVPHLASLPLCPHCHIPVRPDRLTKHLARVHPLQRPN